MAKNGPARNPDNKSRHPFHSALFIRSIYAESLLEDFFVSAVASVLAIRLYLHLTGYPQLGFGNIHIAHTLWGGVLMLIALVILLAFLGRSSKTFAAVLGGVGFGTFLDELGKFVTTDNDYFFRPTVALIYIIFVLIFFGIRVVGSRRSLSSQECLANAFDIARKGSLVGLSQEEKNSAMRLLEGCEESPVSDNLRIILQNTQVSRSRPSQPVAGFRNIMDRYYKWAASKWWFGGIVITFFALTAVTPVSAVVAVAERPLWGLTLGFVAGVIILLAMVWSLKTKTRYLSSVISVSIVIISIMMSWAIVVHLKGMPFSIIEWAKFVFPGISGMLITIGILILPRSRLRAYLMFQRAILVSIFFTQVLSFYDEQLLALVGLVLDILILIALRYLIKHENIKAKSQFSV